MEEFLDYKENVKKSFMWDFPNKNRGKKTKKVREILKLSSFIFQIIKLLKLLAPKKREYNIECIVI